MGVAVTGKMISIGILVSTLITGCSAERRAFSAKNVYKETFKQTYYLACLKYGFNNSPEINKLLKEDKSGFGELILGEQYFYIDSLARMAAERMKDDSVRTAGKRAEGADGKRVFSTTLHDYNSKWLNTLAKKAWRDSRKSKED